MKRVGVTLLALGAIAYLHDSHRVYPAESRATMRLLLTAQSQTALQSCGCQTKQLGGLARTAALVRKLSREGESVLLEVAPKWPTGEQAEVVAKTLELLKCDAVACLDPDQAPASRAGRWLKPKDSGVATIPGHGALVRFHGLVEVAQPPTDAKGERPQLHCRLERAPGPDQGAALLLWPAVQAGEGQTAEERELRVPLRLDGRCVNVIDLQRDRARWQARWEHVPVDASAAEDLAVKALVDRYYRQRAHVHEKTRPYHLRRAENRQAVAAGLRTAVHWFYACHPGGSTLLRTD